MDLDFRLIAILGLSVGLMSCDCRMIQKEKEKAVVEAVYPELVKLESIILPVVDFENTTVEEAIDFFRIRSIELDPDLIEETEKAVSFVVRKPRVEGEIEESFEGEGGLLGGEADAAAVTIPKFYAENISILDALIETSKIAELDLYFTSRGLLLLPGGTVPREDFLKGGKVLKVIRKSNPR